MPQLQRHLEEVPEENVMINANRALRVSFAAWAFLALALILMSGCASEKPAPKAEPTAPPPQPVSLTQIKSELLEAKSQIQMTTESLNKLHKSSGSDAQANYNAFGEQYLKLQAKSDAVRARAKDLKEKSQAFYAMWNRQVEVENPELRRQAVQQKADAERIYSTITNEMELARLAFDPYMSNLKDVGNYLRGNVTPANLNSIGDLVTRANGQAKEVDSHLAAIVESVDKITAATGEGAATAPSAGAGAR